MQSLGVNLVMAAAVLLVEFVRYGKLLLPLYVVIGGIAYVTMLRVLRAVDREDMELLRGFLG